MYNPDKLQKRIPNEIVDQKIIVTPETALPETGFDPEATQTITVDSEAMGENVVVDEAFSGLAKGIEVTTQPSAEAVGASHEKLVVEERARQEVLKKQREQDKLELQALRAKLNMDSDDTIPIQ